MVRGPKLLAESAGKDLGGLWALPGRTRMRTKQRIEKFFVYLMLAIVGVGFLVPFYWVITASIKTSAELHRMPPTWWPHSFTLEHYPQALTLEFGRYFLNSLIYAMATTPPLFLC
jgi:multiple sugar transport system permease protein